LILAHFAKHDPTSGESIRIFAIITTDANNLVALGDHRQMVAAPT